MNTPTLTDTTGRGMTPTSLGDDRNYILENYYGGDGAKMLVLEGLILAAADDFKQLARRGIIYRDAAGALRFKGRIHWERALWLKRGRRCWQRRKAMNDYGTDQSIRDLLEFVTGCMADLIDACQIGLDGRAFVRRLIQLAPINDERGRR